MERFKSITIILLLAFAVLASAAQTKPASVLLQEGLYAEQIEGNLEAAIKVYERILKEFPKNRPVAAKALLHIGLSYEKLGRSEARKAYERVLREYADQPEAVSAARVRLTTLGQQEGGQGPIVRRVWADAADSYLQGAPSPDGRYLSCVWDGDLAIRDLATGQNRRLTNEGLVGKGWASNSVFSPDGKQLAYTWWNDEKGDDELRVVGVDGSEPRVIHHRSLEEKTSLHRPAGWSPDGKHILALGAKDGSPQILLVPPEDGPVRVLTTLPKKSHPFWIHYGGGFSANLSPNGQFVAYTFFPRDDSGTRDIWAVAVDGSGERLPKANRRAPPNSSKQRSANSIRSAWPETVLFTMGSFPEATTSTSPHSIHRTETSAGNRPLPFNVTGARTGPRPSRPTAAIWPVCRAVLPYAMTATLTLLTAFLFGPSKPEKCGNSPWN